MQKIWQIRSYLQPKSSPKCASFQNHIWVPLDMLHMHVVYKNRIARMIQCVISLFCLVFR